MRDLRHDWTLPEIESIDATPLPEPIFSAQRVHHRPDELQRCTLLGLGKKLTTAEA